jgi:hypothetical protein
MSQQAVRGLRRWIAEHRDVVEELGRIPVASRLAQLEQASPRVDPTIPPPPPPPTKVEAALRRHATDIRPGLNLLRGEPAEVVRAIEELGRQHGGTLATGAARAKLLEIVRRYQTQAAKLQSGGGVETLNFEGARGEIQAVIATLERGETVDTVGDAVKFRVDPARVPLLGGITVVNAPRSTPAQLDVGSHDANWQITLVETTTGTLSLPPALRHLDPQSGVSGSTTIDWHALDVDDPNWGSSNRKWRQLIARYQLAVYLAELDAAFNGGPGNVTRPPTQLVLRVSGITQGARRVAERVFGVRIEIVPR